MHYISWYGLFASVHRSTLQRASRQAVSLLPRRVNCHMADSIIDGDAPGPGYDYIRVFAAGAHKALEGRLDLRRVLLYDHRHVAPPLRDVA